MKLVSNEEGSYARSKVGGGGDGGGGRSLSCVWHRTDEGRRNCCFLVATAEATATRTTLNLVILSRQNDEEDVEYDESDESGFRSLASNITEREDGTGWREEEEEEEEERREATTTTASSAAAAALAVCLSCRP